MELYNYPLATTLNSTTPWHELQPHESPQAVNVWFDKGVVRKRLGITTIKDFEDYLAGNEILSGHRGNSQYMLICVGKSSVDSSGVIYEYDTESSQSSPTITSKKTSLHKSNTWTFTDHYDRTIGQTTVMSNNSDPIQYYCHSAQTISQLSAERSVAFTSGGTAELTAGTDIEGATGGATATVTYVSLSSGTWAGGDAAGTIYLKDQTGTFEAENLDTTGQANICTIGGNSAVTNGPLGKYLASFYDRIWLAYISDDGYGTADSYGVMWTDVDDATDFTAIGSSVAGNQRRPEDGLVITGLKKRGDILFLGKGGNDKENQLWAIAPFSNFARIKDNIGPSNHGGMSGAKNFYFNDKGRILDPEENWISEPIHTLFASADPGTWDVAVAENIYNGHVYFTTGEYLFKYIPLTNAWEMHRFSDTVKILGNTRVPGTAAQSWVGIPSKHKALSVAEEDIISDPILKLGTSKLVVQNHFADDDDDPIDSVYCTRLDPMGDPERYDRGFKIRLQVNPDQNTGTYKIYTCFCDVPKNADWKYQGEITTDSNGTGEIDIDERGKYSAVMVRENSTKPFTIYKLGVRYEPHAYR